MSRLGQAPAALTPSEKRIDRLALSTTELASALGVSDAHVRKFDLPHVWLGERKLYPIDVIRDWLRDQARRNDESAAEAKSGNQPPSAG